MRALTRSNRAVPSTVDVAAAPATAVLDVLMPQVAYDGLADVHGFEIAGFVYSVASSKWRSGQSANTQP